MSRAPLPTALAASALAALALACHGGNPVGPIADPVVMETAPLVACGGSLGEHVGLEVVIQRDAAGTSLGLMTVSGFVLESFGYRAYALVTPLGVPCPAEVYELVVVGGGPTHDFGGTIPVPATASTITAIVTDSLPPRVPCGQGVCLDVPAGTWGTSQTFAILPR